jgi:hypothetical protein
MSRIQPPTVFQSKLSNARIHVTYRHIDDIMTASRDLRFEDRIDYCAANGLDLINIIRYFDFVQKLEDNYNLNKKHGQRFNIKF